MKTIELYLEVLHKVRYSILKNECTLNDFKQGDKSYDLLCKVNEACNELSSLIDVMMYECKL